MRQSHQNFLGNEEWGESKLSCHWHPGYSGNDPGVTRMLFDDDHLNVDPKCFYMCCSQKPADSHLLYYKLGGEQFKWVAERSLNTIMRRIQEGLHLSHTILCPRLASATEPRSLLSQ